MSLRQKTLLLIGLTLAGLIGVLYASLSLILIRSFAQIEEQHAYRNVRRVQEALFDELDSLAVLAADYGEWDDTYAFIEDTSQNYIQENLSDTNLTNINLNLVLFFNRQDELVFGKHFNLAQQQEIPIPTPLIQQLNSDNVLLQHPDTTSSITGLILLPQGPLMIASNPILTNEETGPMRGSLIMGRYLNDQRIEALAELTQLNLKVYRLDNTQLPAKLQTVQSSLSEQESQPNQAPILIQIISREAIAGYTLLRDIYGQPALLVQIDIPREIYQQGRLSLRYLILSLLGLGILFSVGTLFLLEKMVLSRLAKLSTNVQKVGTSNDLSLRVSAKGNDELTHLAQTINSMLDALESSTKNLVTEREKAENLLLNILPESIAKRLQKDSDTIADSFEEVTVLFSDIVDFTRLSGEISPTELVNLLNEIFSRFDRLVELHGLEKIKTIGDSYMVVGGLPLPRQDHAEAVAEFALDMQGEIDAVNAQQGHAFMMRIGIHSGPVVAGVIGLKKFIYDLWGDTVNTASRMESHGLPGYIQVSDATYEHLKDKYVFQERGSISVKGKGEMTTYFLKERKPKQIG
ncbi:adenylate/guanylate cyclase domain-containing protein [Coleofasciculus sp. E1-EBD-02]|uniref:adenylate/guanylate cyclase domain-containing protein n=1 Tax=Coleofasciculus sp. E1-EBD-02 TaxID=3068481 RepID=UPI0032FC0702